MTHSNNPDTSTPAVDGELEAILKEVQSIPRRILYTDTVNNEQTCRDDLWAISTSEIEELRTILAATRKQILDEVEAKVIGGKTSLNDIYGTDRRNNYGYNETQVRDAVNYLQNKQRAALAALKEKI
jgi:hypothetical protein